MPPEDEKKQGKGLFLKMSGKPSENEIAELKKTAKAYEQQCQAALLEQIPHLHKTDQPSFADTPKMEGIKSSLLDLSCFTPINIPSIAICKMDIKDLVSLLAREHPKYKNKTLSQETLALVMHRLEELRRANIDKHLATIIDLTKKPKKQHWTVWVILVATIITTLIAVWQTFPIQITPPAEPASEDPLIQKQAFEFVHDAHK